MDDKICRVFLKNWVPCFFLSVERYPVYCPVEFPANRLSLEIVLNARRGALHICSPVSSREWIEIALQALDLMECRRPNVFHVSKGPYPLCSVYYQSIFMITKFPYRPPYTIPKKVATEIDIRTHSLIIPPESLSFPFTPIASIIIRNLFWFFLFTEVLLNWLQRWALED